MDGGGGQVQLRVRDADAGGDDVEPVALAALDDFGVAGGYGDAGLLRGPCHRRYLAFQDFGVQTLLDDEGGGEAERGGAGDGQVVDGAVYRELPDRAAGEDERLHYEGVGG